MDFDLQAATTFDPAFVDVVYFGGKILSATTTLHSIVSLFNYRQNLAAVYVCADRQSLVCYSHYSIIPINTATKRPNASKANMAIAPWASKYEMLFSIQPNVGRSYSGS